MSRPRFNVRNALWLIVVVALGLGWFVDRSRLYDHYEHERVFVEELESLGISPSSLRKKLSEPSMFPQPRIVVPQNDIEQWHKYFNKP